MKMKCTVLIIVLLQCIAKGVCLQEGVSLIGTALSAFSPCSNYAVYMQHESGQPPSLDNYWDGTIDFDTADNPADEFVIKIALVSPAEIILKTAGGNVEKDGNVFQIKFPTRPQTSYVKLKVQGKKGELFPDIASLHINNVDVCPNPKHWNRKPLGEGNVATSDDYNL